MALRSLAGTYPRIGVRSVMYRRLLASVEITLSAGPDA